MSDFNRPGIFFVVVFFLSFVLFFTSWSPSQENGEWDTVPDGSFEQIREFEKKLNDERRRRNQEFSEKYSKGENKEQDYEELQKFNTKWDDLQKVIAEKILALPELSKEAKQHAYFIKWNIARSSPYLQTSIPKLETLMEECGDDPDLADTKQMAFRDWLRNSVLNTNSVEVLDTLFEKMLDYSKTDEQFAIYSCETFFQKLAEMPSEKVGDRAESYFQRIKEMLVNSENEKTRAFLSKLEGKHRFHTLIGKEMELKGITLDEKTLDLSDYHGKVVYVDFWATWCGPCVGEMPELHDTYQTLRDAGFEVISYSIDEDRNDLISFQEEHKYIWPVISVLDSMKKEFRDYYEYYGGGYVPKTALIGRDGKVIQTDIRGDQLKRKLEELFAEEFEKKMDDPNTSVSAKVDFYTRKLARADWSDEVLGKSIALLLEHKNDHVPNIQWLPNILLHAYHSKAVSHQNGDADLLSFAKKMRDELKDAKNESLKAFSVQMENLIRRLELPGQPMEFEAVFLDGEQRKLADFQGKPVLICMLQYTIPPGMDEAMFHNPLPGFLSNFQKINDLYHDKLTVLVYMFDTQERFISQIKQSVPEKNLATVEASTGKGLKNYWTYYAIRETPAWFLVDATGKVVKLERRKGIVNSLKEFFESNE